MKSKCWVLAIIHIHYRRKVTLWNSCARLLTCVRVPIHSVQCSASVTTWRLLFTSSSMKRASSISIRRSLRLPIVKVPDRCSRWLPWTCMTWRKTREVLSHTKMISSVSRQVWLFPVSWKVSWQLLLWDLSTHSVLRSVPKTPILPATWQSSGWLNRKLLSTIL